MIVDANGSTFHFLADSTGSRGASQCGSGPRGTDGSRHDTRDDKPGLDLLAGDVGELGLGDKLDDPRTGISALALLASLLLR